MAKELESLQVGQTVKVFYDSQSPSRSCLRPGFFENTLAHVLLNLFGAFLLAAGLRGIEKGYELPPEAEDDVWSLTDTERRAAGYEDLPVSLGEALTAMQGSELVAETLGEHVFEFFLRNKWEEFNSYRQNVTPFELRRYLPGL